MLKIGQRIPPAYLASLSAEGEVLRECTERMFAGVKAIIVGVPGAFTPVCTHEHLPQFITAAARLRASGFQRIVCVATSDPYSLDAWARVIDPQRELAYYSDGNLAFARACGLLRSEEDLFLGARSQRYVLTIEDAIVMRMRVEESVLAVSCTRPQDIVSL